ncbi:hypothetical protein NGM99_17015 [Mesorhizobium sp. RP14(2022)]|uniref:Uncharacterized protein n=1 Tax=Mesorhizobium liriopis TaxID=2953882 RepID=A0ABT1CAH2_9HYPH|nr:hypothetical protein [Mesorhizobium liriopis]MCO6051488.1 hypothetical protein [Mesorhizobium liriopis]
MTALLTRVLRRRTLMKALLVLPAFSILRNLVPPTQTDETVEIDGWILKRSDLA